VNPVDMGTLNLSQVQSHPYSRKRFSGATQEVPVKEGQPVEVAETDVAGEEAAGQSCPGAPRPRNGPDRHDGQAERPVAGVS